MRSQTNLKRSLNYLPRRTDKHHNTPHSVHSEFWPKLKTNSPVNARS